MSQIAVTNRERHVALERLGYNEREAQFLCAAGLQSGYFLRRQYASYLGGQDGGNVTQLIEKVLDFGHAEAATYKERAHIYHLSGRSFYAALGQEDNRNRRRKELVTIKSKLMALDFVLAHLNYDYLATELEKMRFFEEIFHVDPNHLPAKKYAGQGQLTARYFVEKYPIFYCPSPQPASPPVVSFCFIDPGFSGATGFETFLSHYSNLFSHLRDFAVIYVAGRENLFAKVRTAFERFSNGGSPATNTIGLNGSTEKVLEYFETRRLFESKQFASFDRAKLIRFRDQQQQYAGQKIEALYERWKKDARPFCDAGSDSKSGCKVVGHASFSTYLLEHSYDLFGSVTTY